MTREVLLTASLQSGVLLLMIWTIFRLVPAIPPNAKAWIWRIALTKPLLCLLPFAVVTLQVLPAPPSVETIVHPSTRVVATVSSLSTTEPVDEEASRSFDFVIGLWLLGTAGVGAYGLREWLRAIRIVRQAEPVASRPILSALADLTQHAGVMAPIRLLSSPDVEGATLVGGREPTIVLPLGAIQTGSPADARLMLAHEVAHIARRDLPWFGLIWVVQSLFFFNPVVWLAARWARLDHESATDRYASQLAGVPVQTYAEMLVRATVVARTSLVPGAIPMAESYRTIHRRLAAMKHFNSRPSLWRKPAIGAIAVLTAGLLPMYQLATAAPSEAPQNKANHKSAKNRLAIDNKKTAKISTGSLATETARPPRRVMEASSGTGFSKMYRGEGGVSTAGARGGGISGGASFSTGGAVAEHGMTAQEFAEAHASERGSEQHSTQSSSSDGGFTTSEGSVYGSASGQGAGSVTRTVNGKTETVNTGSSESWSTQYTYGSSASGTSDGGSSSRSSGSISGTSTPSIDKISFKFEQYDVRSALQSLFRQGHMPYSIDPRLRRKVTAVAKDVSFDSALQILLRAANATFRKEGETYILSPRNP